MLIMAVTFFCILLVIERMPKTNQGRRIGWQPVQPRPSAPPRPPASPPAASAAASIPYARTDARGKRAA